MNKRGIKHIEVILSFVLFISVVIFALWFFNPGEGSRRVDSSLDYSFREIIQNTSIELETFSININNIEVSGEGHDGSTLVFRTEGVDAGLENSYVKSRSGETLDSRRNGNFVNVDSPVGGWSGVDFIFVYLGRDFETGTAVGGVNNESFYTISSRESKEVVSEMRFSELKEIYFSDYLSLREDFNLHANWAFSLELADISIVAEEGIHSDVEIFSETRRVEVLRNNGNIEFGDLTVKVW